MTEIDSDEVEADVRRFLGEGYATQGALAQYEAATAAERRQKAHAQAVQIRIADERALAAARLFEEETGSRGEKKDFAESRLGLTRQRFNQLLGRAQELLARVQGLPAESNSKQS